MIREFKLMNWRSFERARFVFERKNLFIGPNGSGKSNLLEALNFLGVLRSFRTVRIDELIRQGSSSFHLRGDWCGKTQSVELEVGMDNARNRTLQINRLTEHSGRNFIQHFIPVVFAPEDMDLITGAPAVRRRFFDMISSQLDDGYINVLHDYQGALRLRNLLLRSGRKVDWAQMDVYERLLAFAGADLTERRRLCVQEFNRTLAALALDKSSELSVEYRPQCADGAESYLELFARSRSRELDKRTTLCGCHLDDFRWYRGGAVMRGFASNGQNRLAALHCKLAAAMMVMQKRGKDKLVAVIDDVTGELDEHNRTVFFDLLRDAGQIFCTFTEMPPDKFLQDARIWNLQLD